MSGLLNDDARFVDVPLPSSSPADTSSSPHAPLLQDEDIYLRKASGATAIELYKDGATYEQLKGLFGLTELAVAFPTSLLLQKVPLEYLIPHTPLSKLANAGVARSDMLNLCYEEHELDDFIDVEDLW